MLFGGCVDIASPKKNNFGVGISIFKSNAQNNNQRNYRDSNQILHDYGPPNTLCRSSQNAPQIQNGGQLTSLKE